MPDTMESLFGPVDRKMTCDRVVLTLPPPVKVVYVSMREMFRDEYVTLKIGAMMNRNLTQHL